MEFRYLRFPRLPEDRDVKDVSTSVDRSTVEREWTVLKSWSNTVRGEGGVHEDHRRP